MHVIAWNVINLILAFRKACFFIFHCKFRKSHDSIYTPMNLTRSEIIYPIYEMSKDRTDSRRYSGLIQLCSQTELPWAGNFVVWKHYWSKVQGSALCPGYKSMQQIEFDDSIEMSWILHNWSHQKLVTISCLYKHFHFSVLLWRKKKIENSKIIRVLQ